MRLNDNNTFIGINPPYQLSVIHSSKLIYPREIYQRGVERKRVELIARDFNEYIVNEPKVSFRNGRYYVMDGQHTIEGCILLNGGAGLGLSLVWEIADLHGGSVWVEESSDKGTTIAVELPAGAKNDSSGADIP